MVTKSSNTFTETLQFIEEVHRSIDNTEMQRIYKSCITELFGEFIKKQIIKYIGS